LNEPPNVYSTAECDKPYVPLFFLFIMHSFQEVFDWQEGEEALQEKGKSSQEETEEVIALGVFLNSDLDEDCVTL